jgi:hypothetical protein
LDLEEGKLQRIVDEEWEIRFNQSDFGRQWRLDAKLVAGTD